MRGTDTPIAADASWALGTELHDALAVEMDAHDAARRSDFPERAWDLLHRDGLTGVTADLDAAELAVARELRIVRAVGTADVSLARLLDGHLNAVQRLRVQVDPDVAGPDLDAVVSEGLRLGVWGADPAGPAEGEPARLRRTSGAGRVLDGVKTFCSGAGGLHRAFVLAREGEDPGPLRLAYVDLTAGGVAVDTSWYRGEGMRGSASHRVSFDGAPVLWTADAPRALLAQPWFAQDGLRTAAGWAGGADSIVDATRATLAAKPSAGDVEALALARLSLLQTSLGLWLDAGASALEHDTGVAADTTLLARVAIADTVREIIDEASRALGARPFAIGGRVERARRDLLTYLLQHRLEPPLVALGRRALGSGA